jgi:hypothetical protein
MPSFSRKDYELAASVINQTWQASIFGEPHKAACVDIADEFAGVFADDNPKFDRDRFMKACGLPEEASDFGKES